MGAVISADSLADLTENVLLKRLSGNQSMDSNDPQWNKLFSFNLNLNQRSRKMQMELLDQLDPLLEHFMHNTRDTGNFATLINVFNKRCPELDASVKFENKIFLWQATNSLLIIRYACVFFAQRLSPPEFANIFKLKRKQKIDSIEQSRQTGKQAQAPIYPTGDIDNKDGKQFESVAECFLTNLAHILTQIPINSLSLQLHAESLRMIIALLSTQLYEGQVSELSEFLHLLMTRLAKPAELMHVLMENFLHHCNEQLDWDDLEASNGGSRTDSIIVSLWATLQKSLALSRDVENEEADGFPPQSLSSLSLSLLHILSSYPSFAQKQNIFRQLLSIFQNAQEVSSLFNLEASFKLDFSQLYNRLCVTVYKDRMSLLLLYLLLHKNIGFRNYVLSRVNLEQLVLPVIRLLNDGMCQMAVISSNKAASSSESSSPAHSTVFSQHLHRRSSLQARTFNTHQIYLALIVLLMLSEDDFFKKVIHEMTLKNIDWYQPGRAPLSEITLGGLLVLVFSKTIQLNTVRVRDRYFHINSLATLANLSSCFKQLPPLVCQKMIGLLETMTKRHSKLISLLRENAEKQGELLNDPEEVMDGEPHDIREDLHRDITALEEGIRTVLEIINSCLCHNLRNNPDMIYTLLYKRELFEHYHQHPMFQDLVWNIYTVINHFTAKIESMIQPNERSGSTTSALASTASVADILDAIKKTAIEWPTNRLKKFPELQFKYIEDENTVDFFVPFIWRMVHETCAVLFDPLAIQLFNAVD